MAQKLGIRELILKAFARQKELSSEEIFKSVSRAGYSNHGIRSLTHRLYAEGVIERIDHALYRLATLSTGKKIADAVIGLDKRLFTSAEIVASSGSSPRHARRTLLELTKAKALVREGVVYRIVNKSKVRRFK